MLLNISLLAHIRPHEILSTLKFTITILLHVINSTHTCLIIFIFILFLFLLLLSRSTTEHSRELAPNEVHNLVVIALHLRVGLDLGKCVVDDGQEHAHEADVDNSNKQEEEEGTHVFIDAFQGIKVEGAQRKREERLDGSREITIVSKILKIFITILK